MGGRERRRGRGGDIVGIRSVDATPSPVERSVLIERADTAVTDEYTVAYGDGAVNERSKAAVTQTS